MSHANPLVMMDTEALYTTCRHNLDVELNRLLAQVISPLTASLRFEGALNVHLTERQRIWCLVLAFTLCCAAARRSASGEGPPCTVVGGNESPYLSFSLLP